MKVSVRDAFARDIADAPDLADLSWAARRVLVEAAILFHERGAAATSVRDIAKACGLTPGAFYKHFPSKDEALHRLVTHGHDSMDERLAEARAAADRAPLAQLAAFVRAYVMGHLVRPELARLARREYVHLSAGRRAEVVERRRRLRTDLERMLKAGVRHGEVQLIDGRHAATRTAIMMLDMCSRTSEWYDPDRPRSARPEALADCYVSAALRIAGVY